MRLRHGVRVVEGFQRCIRFRWHVLGLRAFIHEKKPINDPNYYFYHVENPRLIHGSSETKK